ncbi:Rad52/Rad22 family DNA repair protein [Sulfurospirillum barnesii]|uniref:Recombination DNA repair protein (RAD52 pathway) n=1 Tax=Sulfurospirillum barnesii (strain ATCC 700032 / DSM 10660 / SES-3) TaxID=760154 RepID=I3Y092_SULBS|nr:Rad52/Rad22 family DNA repair protein [Sulfurospirillum barnesii]AFL69616.1 recombination DNA repair protein (RAD52 pathway) [Sulfurospirillum barnesii SES-3]
MFDQPQNQALAQELENTRIKSRSKGDIELAYLEGFDVIDTANRIFGYGNWSYNISTLEQVSQESNQNQNIVICYKAVVSVKVSDAKHEHHISREDVGFGTGIAKTLSDAHESAAKEAVTDALKRSMRSFGNQFGNSLYDKSRQHQNSQQPQPSNKVNAIPQDYSKLSNLGLSVMQQGQNLIVMGDDIFAKKDTIKACGFKWDGRLKHWCKPLEQQAA